MSKANEKAYLKNIGEDGQKHALNKPYSDKGCGLYFMDIGAIMSLLPAPPGKLLDLGVGTGWTSVFFAQRGYDVTGQDISEDMILFAEKNKRRYNLETLKFITCDYEDLSFNNEFDIAVFYDSLHHSVNVQEAINAVYRALKPDGIFVAIEPGSGHSKSNQSKEAMKKWGVTERDMPPYLIVRFGKKAGFSKAKIYVRQNHPFEIMPYLSLKGLANVCRLFFRFLPGIGQLKSNISMMIK